LTIIGGEKKGFKLKITKDIRITSQRVKKVLFDILKDVDGKIFVDLFAGTGNVGLEALSRGAYFCYFIENNREITKILNENIRKLGYEGSSKVIFGDVFKLKIPDADIYFADPPYNKGYAKRILKKLKDKKGLLIIEHSKFEKINCGEQRQVGDTILTFINLEELDKNG